MLDDSIEAVPLWPRQLLAPHFVASDRVSKDINSLIGFLTFDKFGSHIVGSSGTVTRSLKVGSVWNREAKIDAARDAFYRGFVADAIKNYLVWIVQKNNLHANL